MIYFIMIFGLILGSILNVTINKISFIINKINNDKTFKQKYISFKGFSILVISLIFTIISFVKFGFSFIFFMAVVLNSILIIVSFIDFKHEIIPNRIIIIILCLGFIYVLTGNISIKNALLGMITGGGILFLLGIIPHALGGGDIKLMFSLGAFLGLYKTISTIFIAFMLAAVVSTILLLFKIKRRNDNIPFGPFIALGCFIAFHFITF